MRAMSSAMLTALTSTELFPAIFVQANFATGPVYLWSGLGTISWNSHNWLGIGTLGGISTIGEGSTVEAKGITLTLSGFDATLLPLVMTEFQLALPVTVYLGLFNAGALIADPIPGFVGRMDQPIVQVDGKTAIININCESRLMDMNFAVKRRYTADDQQRDWPGDLGFQFISEIIEMTLYWGSAPTSTNNV